MNRKAKANDKTDAVIRYKQWYLCAIQTRDNRKNVKLTYKRNGAVMIIAKACVTVTESKAVHTKNIKHKNSKSFFRGGMIKRGFFAVSYALTARYPNIKSFLSFCAMIRVCP